MKLFILAGEPSGDRIGADLVERLRARVTSLELSGVGGADLTGQGLASMFPMRELSVMGWRDILPRLPWLHLRAWQVARAIVRNTPDVVVLVDAQIFSAVVAGHVRRMGGTMPIVLYVAPAVWAWAPGRATKIKPLFDEVMAVLPFEPRVMRELGGPTTHYVGHPAVGRLAFRDTAPERGALLLMPGSRDGELRRHLPLFRDAAEAISHHPRVTRLVLPTLPFLADRLRREVAAWSVPVEVVTGPEARTAAYAEALAACTSMGTATLELALSGVPMVGTYVADAGQEKRWYKYGVKFASLPNVMLDRMVVPEALFPETGIDPAQLSAALNQVLEPAQSAAQVAAFGELRSMMINGLPGDPLEDPAARVLAIVSADRSGRSLA